MVPVMAQEIFCIPVLLYWIYASVCPLGCQMVGVLGLESLVLASQTGEAAWALQGGVGPQEPEFFPAGLVGLLLLRDDKLPQPAPHQEACVWMLTETWEWWRW